MGGPAVLDHVKTLITEVWIEYKDRGDDPPAKEVLVAARERLRREGRDSLRLPKLRKTQAILAEARKRFERLPQRQGNLDTPWCIGSLEQYDMLQADIMWALRVWKLRLTTGRLFSVRDAKWVARLHNIIADTASLDMWASLYSLRERASEALAEPCDTSDLDAELVMGAWELATASWLGKVESFQSQPGRLLSHGRPLEFGDSTSMEAVKTAEGPYHAELPPLGDLNLLEEAEWVYAHWLQFLRTGPKWKSLPVKEHLSIIQELRLWVRNHPWRRDATVKHLLGIEQTGDASTCDSERVAGTSDLRPSSLLQEVGHET